MNKRIKWAIGAGAVLAIGSTAFFAGRAFAGGIPASGALTYSGVLQDASGAPLTGTQYVEVKFWNSATASDATANLLCDSGTPASVSLQVGHFSVGLPDTCTTSIGANKDVWAEVFVGSSAAAAASLGRVKLGAVPYAIEANHAVSADSASAPSGALATSIEALASKAEIPIVTAWAAYTPDVTNDEGTAPTQSSTGQWRRIGDTIEVNIMTTMDDCTGTGQVRWSLPGSLTVDVTKLSWVYSQVGTGYVYYRVGGKLETVAVVAQNTGGNVVLEDPSVGAGGLSCTPLASTQPLFRMQFSLPIQGWNTNN